MKNNAAKLLIASVTILARVRLRDARRAARNCQWDYHNFCDQYAIGSELLDTCFKLNGPKLSKPSVDAPIAAGDTSQEYVDQQKKLLGK